MEHQATILGLVLIDLYPWIDIFVLTNIYILTRTIWYFLFPCPIKKNKKKKKMSEGVDACEC